MTGRDIHSIPEHSANIGRIGLNTLVGHAVFGSAAIKVQVINLPHLYIVFDRNSHITRNLELVGINISVKELSIVLIHESCAYISSFFHVCYIDLDGAEPVVLSDKLL